MFEKKEKYTGENWNGDTVSFNKVWGGHEFTDEECVALLHGETITLRDCISKSGKTFGCYGKLEQQDFNGHSFWGFKRTEWLNEDRVPDVWCGHRFTDDEKQKLEEGHIIHLTDTMSMQTNRSFECDIRWGVQDNGDMQKYIIPNYNTDIPTTDQCNDSIC